MKYIISENQFITLLEGKLPPTLMKLFGAQTAKKMDSTFAKEIDKIETFFSKIITSGEKNLILKGGNYYFKSSLGLDYPTSTIQKMIDMSLSGKINKTNLESYVSLIPEKFYNGGNFRENIRILLKGTIDRVESNVGKINKPSNFEKKPKSTSQNITKSSFTMASPEESFKLAGWFDQKFYESGDKRHSEITNAQFEKMLPETKEYLKKLYKKMKELYPNSNSSRKLVNTDKDAVYAVTQNYWGGFGRQGDLVGKNLKNPKNTPSLPLPSKSVENNLNSIFPTPSNSQYSNGKNFWNSSN